MILFACYVGFCVLCCSGLLAQIRRERDDQRGSAATSGGDGDGSAHAPGGSADTQPARKTTMETAT